MTTPAFTDMRLPDVLQDSLQRMQFTQPTPIQAQAIPPALAGQDILGSAQTGTGKTAAFLLPALTHLLRPDGQHNQVLVITPTRELAQQVLTQAQTLLGAQILLNCALLIGGDSMHKQLKQLQKKPRLIIGTPGRINDHLRRKSVALQQCNFLVLDETDRMLDMGFSVQLETILTQLNPKRQTLLFSATFPENTQMISAKYQNDPLRVNVDPDNKPAQQIHQETLQMPEAEKYETLLTQLEQRQGTVIIFMKTKFSTERMAKQLTKAGYSSDAIHGDLRQSRRTKVLLAFRREKFRVLVATDVAARGLDVPHIEHVINYDLPQSPEDYIHRIGRTARAGAKGSAVNFVSPSERRLWTAIDALMHPEKYKNKRVPSGFTQKRASRKPAVKRGQARAGRQPGNEAPHRQQQMRTRSVEASDTWMSRQGGFAGSAKAKPHTGRDAAFSGSRSRSEQRFNRTSYHAEQSDGNVQRPSSGGKPRGHYGRQAEVSAKGARSYVQKGGARWQNNASTSSPRARQSDSDYSSQSSTKRSNGRFSHAPSGNRFKSDASNMQKSQRPKRSGFAKAPGREKQPGQQRSGQQRSGQQRSGAARPSRKPIMIAKTAKNSA